LGTADPFPNQWSRKKLSVLMFLFEKLISSKQTRKRANKPRDASLFPLSWDMAPCRGRSCGWYSDGKIQGGATGAQWAVWTMRRAESWEWRGERPTSRGLRGGEAPLQENDRRWRSGQEVKHWGIGTIGFRGGVTVNGNDRRKLPAQKEERRGRELITKVAQARLEGRRVEVIILICWGIVTCSNVLSDDRPLVVHFLNRCIASERAFSRRKDESWLDFTSRSSLHGWCRRKTVPEVGNSVSNIDWDIAISKNEKKRKRLGVYFVPSQRKMKSLELVHILGKV
jgi:hypothetical protein